MEREQASGMHRAVEGRNSSELDERGKRSRRKHPIHPINNGYLPVFD